MSQPGASKPWFPSRQDGDLRIAARAAVTEGWSVTRPAPEHVLLLLDITEAAELLIDRTVTDLYEVGRRELRLSQLLHQARRDTNNHDTPSS